MFTFLCQMKYVIFYEFFYFLFLGISAGLKLLGAILFLTVWILMSVRDRKDSGTITVCYILSILS